jgi:hypothetical protein
MEAVKDDAAMLRFSHADIGRLQATVGSGAGLSLTMLGC